MQSPPFLRYFYTGVTNVKLKDTRHSLGTNGEAEYKILKFSAYYEKAKFTGKSIRLVRQIKVGGIFKQGNQLRIL